MKKTKDESLRNELIKIVKNAYNNNIENYELILKSHFKNDEYFTNNESIVIVKGCIDKNGIMYFQFHINVVGINSNTVFYRFDYCDENKNTIEETDDNVIEGIDIPNIKTYTNKDLWIY